MTVGMLIIFGGLPGTGKTTLAREIARRMSATYVRIDSIEKAVNTSLGLDEAGIAGYMVGYAVAADNLRLGLTVVADSVNPIAITRDAWVNVAKDLGIPFVEVEVVCSDSAEHRRRVESRSSDIPGFILPTWQQVVDREYEAWDRAHVDVDTGMGGVEESVDYLIRQIWGESSSIDAD